MASDQPQPQLQPPTTLPVLKGLDVVANVTIDPSMHEYLSQFTWRFYTEYTPPRTNVAITYRGGKRRSYYVPIFLHRLVFYLNQMDSTSWPSPKLLPSHYRHIRQLPYLRLIDSNYLNCQSTNIIASSAHPIVRQLIKGERPQSLEVKNSAIEQLINNALGPLPTVIKKEVKVEVETEDGDEHVVTPLPLSPPSPPTAEDKLVDDVLDILTRAEEHKGDNRK